MSRVVTNVINERRHRVLIDRHELKRIVGEAVAKEIGIRHAAPGQTWDFNFKDETEGSPAYKVGTGCIVDVIEDMGPQAGPADEAPKDWDCRTSG
jgi:hypothetical protein